MSKINWNITNGVAVGKYAEADFTELPINETVRVFAFPNPGYFALNAGTYTINGNPNAIALNSNKPGYLNIIIIRKSETQVSFGTSSTLYDIEGLEVNATCVFERDIAEIGIVITRDLKNCAQMPFDYLAYEGGAIFIKAEKGFGFESAPTALKNGSTTITGTRFNAASFGDEVYRILLGTGGIMSVAISGTAVRTEPLTEIDITNNLSNAVASSYLLKLTESNAFEITANDGYSFETPPFIRIKTETDVYDLPFELSDDKYVLSVDGTQYGEATSASFEGTAQKIALKSPITLDSELAEFTEDSATEINENDTSYRIEVRTKGGFMFAKPPKISVTYSEIGGGSTRQTVSMSQKTGALNTYYYEITTGLLGDADPANFFNANVANGTPSIETDIIKETALLSDFGQIRAYKTDKTINNDLKNKRFYNVAENEYYDMANYILSFVRYPFDVTTLGSTTVRYGWFDTGITAGLVERGEYSFTLGKKVVKGLYGNSSDIANAEITLVLPYIGIHKIDAKYVNTEIEIVYSVDILANSCVVDVYSDSRIIDSITTKIGYAIPYILKTDEIRVFADIESTLLKKYEPKAIVRQKPRVGSIPFKTSIFMTLEEVAGRVKCGIVNLKPNNAMTLKEIEMIKQLLKNGIQL